MIWPGSNYLQSLEVYLKRESAATPKLTYVTFYFLVKNLTCLKNINTISLSSLLCRGFWVKLKDVTSLRKINLLCKLSLKIKLTLQIQILKMTDYLFCFYWYTLCMYKMYTMYMMYVEDDFIKAKVTISDAPPVRITLSYLFKQHHFHGFAWMNCVFCICMMSPSFHFKSKFKSF